MSEQFVILHHSVGEGEHWDLMLENSDVLLTWRLLRQPVDRSVLPLPAKRIGDHRTHYLTYEGSISGGRGDVRRVDAGTVEFQELTPTRCAFALRGGRLAGNMLLERSGEAWTLDAVDQPA